MAEALAQMTYDDLVTEVYPYVEGVGRPQLVPIARMAVITACHDSQMLNRTVEFDWEGAADYTMSHVGFVFSRLMAGWLRKPHIFHNRVDPKWLAQLEKCPGQTILHVPDDLHSHVTNLPADVKKLFLRYSLVPTPDSDGFPRLLFEQSPRLFVVACLAQMGPFIKEGNRRVSYGATYKAEYDELWREAKAREEYHGSFGERHPAAMWDDASRGVLPPYIDYL